MIETKFALHLIRINGCTSGSEKHSALFLHMHYCCSVPVLCHWEVVGAAGCRGPHTSVWIPPVTVSLSEWCLTHIHLRNVHLKHYITSERLIIETGGTQMLEERSVQEILDIRGCDKTKAHTVKTIRFITILKHTLSTQITWILFSHFLFWTFFFCQWSRDCPQLKLCKQQALCVLSFCVISLAVQPVSALAQSTAAYLSWVVYL